MANTRKNSRRTFSSKVEMIAHMLTRPEGVTRPEILAATQWPSVSVQQQAQAAGLKLRTRRDGRLTRYFGRATRRH